MINADEARLRAKKFWADRNSDAHVHKVISQLMVGITEAANNGSESYHLKYEPDLNSFIWVDVNHSIIPGMAIPNKVKAMRKRKAEFIRIMADLGYEVEWYQQSPPWMNSWVMSIKWGEKC